ncbi:hypothetical protein K488DRAFT_86945 [Vararia minispora EC-137]|uniref:Uncharacterized protein n=1 Tax=Vararia minispora EC-137 TaxID=1314806 RepID=A0ACB8QI04_9AGAM|nr:hypothetical protein K488DRAFT_86945 [Vararia minispora EC-137]
MLSHLAVSRVVRPAARTAARARYSTAPIHAEYNGLPFNYHNKKTLKYKVIAFFGVPMVVPFIASGYQLWKGGAFSEAK